MQPPLQPLPQQAVEGHMVDGHGLGPPEIGGGTERGKLQTVCHGAEILRAKVTKILPRCILRRFGAFVQNLFIKNRAPMLAERRTIPTFAAGKVPRRRLPARDQKGTPVRIRDYSRSCEFRRDLHNL